jgi:hypothetical protein
MEAQGPGVNYYFLVQDHPAHAEMAKKFLDETPKVECYLLRQLLVLATPFSKALSCAPVLPKHRILSFLPLLGISIPMEALSPAQLG